MEVSCESGRGIRGEIQTFRPSQARAGILGRPWNLSRAGAQRLARPSLRVLQVSSGEQVEACEKNSENSDNLMNINKNMAKLA